MYAAIGAFLVRRARLVLAVSGLALVASVLLAGGAFTKLQGGGFTPAGAESVAARKLVDQKFGGDPNLVLVVEARSGTVDAPDVRAAGADLTTALKAHHELRNVTTYWAAGTPSLRSSDRKYALVLAHVTGTETEQDKTVGAIVDHDLQKAGDAVVVRPAGPLGVSHEIGVKVKKGIALAEGIAVPLTLLLLLVVFGSLVSALLPLLIALLAVLGTFAELSVLGSITDVSVFATNLTTAMALGLAIDYALLSVSRFREELARGRDVESAVIRTVETAGRTIVFSAAAVAAAMCALLVFQSVFLRSLAYAGIGLTVISAVAAVIVLPALLAVLGHRVNAGRIPLVRSSRIAASRPWGRLAGAVIRRPVVFAVPIIAALVFLALPALHISFATPDDRMLPTSADSRQASEVLRTSFGGDTTATVSAVSERPVTRDQVTSYARRLSRLPHVGRVDSSAGRFVAGTLSQTGETDRLGAAGTEQVLITPATGVGPESRAAQDLVEDIRGVRSPGHFLVGGTTAELIDTKDAMRSRLPLAVGLIALTTFVLLFLFTGSVVQPLRALLLNALGLSTVLGLMVLVFQDGHLSGLLDITARPLDTSMPVLLLCIAFGLSMDYEVFVMSRIAELRKGGASTREAVVEGLGRTGRIVSTAAGLIAISFFAWVVSPLTFGKFFGIGTGLAIVLDATVMRGVLLPASFRLLGDASWYAPRFLRRAHDRFGLSEAEEEIPSAPSSVTVTR